MGNSRGRMTNNKEYMKTYIESIELASGSEEEGKWTEDMRHRYFNIISTGWIYKMKKNQGLKLGGGWFHSTKDGSHEKYFGRKQWVQFCLR